MLLDMPINHHPFAAIAKMPFGHQVLVPRAKLGRVRCTRRLDFNPYQLYTLSMRTTDLPIIYQDHHLLIVNKPAGLVSHPTYKHADGTMWDALLLQLARQGSDDWQPPDFPDDPAWAGAPEHIQ